MKNVISVNEKVKGGIMSESLEERIKFIESELNDEKLMNNVDKLSSYYMTSMISIYKSLIENNQWGRLPDGIIKSKKLIKVNRFIPNYIIDMNKGKRIVMSGLFLEVDCYLIPAKLAESAMHKGSILHPEKYGLPTNDEADYATLRSATSTHYVVISKGSWINEWIKYASNYEYVTVS